MLALIKYRIFFLKFLQIVQALLPDGKIESYHLQECLTYPKGLESKVQGLGNSIFTEQIRSLLSFRVWAELKPTERFRFFAHKIQRERIASAAVLQCERYKVMQGIMDGSRIRAGMDAGERNEGGREGRGEGGREDRVEGGARNICLSAPHR